MQALDILTLSQGNLTTLGAGNKIRKVSKLLLGNFVNLM
jgi:hypothetical protein